MFLETEEMLMNSDIHVHVDVRRWRPFDEGIDAHAPEAFSPMLNIYA